MTAIETLLRDRNVQNVGGGMLILSIVGGIINLITKMEIINPALITISSFIGIAIMYYKLKMIHFEYIERKERRKAENLPEIKFRWKFWKSWRKKL